MPDSDRPDIDSHDKYHETTSITLPGTQKLELPKSVSFLKDKPFRYVCKTSN